MLRRCFRQLHLFDFQKVTLEWKVLLKQLTCWAKLFCCYSKKIEYLVNNCFPLISKKWQGNGFGPCTWRQFSLRYNIQRPFDQLNLDKDCHQNQKDPCIQHWQSRLCYIGFLRSIPLKTREEHFPLLLEKLDIHETTLGLLMLYFGNGMKFILLWQSYLYRGQSWRE